MYKNFIKQYCKSFATTCETSFFVFCSPSFRYVITGLTILTAIDGRGASRDCAFVLREAFVQYKITLVGGHHHTRIINASGLFHIIKPPPKQ